MTDTPTLDEQIAALKHTIGCWSYYGPDDCDDPTLIALRAALATLEAQKAPPGGDAMEIASAVLCEVCDAEYINAGAIIARALEAAERRGAQLPLEDPTGDMLARAVRIAAATGAVITETQAHDIWQAMYDEWTCALDGDPI